MPTINSLVWAGRKRLERYAEVFPYQVADKILEISMRERSKIIGHRPALFSQIQSLG